LKRPNLVSTDRIRHSCTAMSAQSTSISQQGATFGAPPSALDAYALSVSEDGEDDHDVLDRATTGLGPDEDPDG
jgi:hypothetical protein